MKVALLLDHDWHLEVDVRTVNHWGNCLAATSVQASGLSRNKSTLNTISIEATCITEHDFATNENMLVIRHITSMPCLCRTDIRALPNGRGTDSGYGGGWSLMWPDIRQTA